MATQITKTAPVAEKLSDTEIKITQQVTTTNVENKTLVFTKDSLLKQREDILAQRNAQIAELEALRDAELAEVDAYLAKCEEVKLMTQAEYEKQVKDSEQLEQPN